MINRFQFRERISGKDEYKKALINRINTGRARYLDEPIIGYQLKILDDFIN